MVYKNDEWCPAEHCNYMLTITLNAKTLTGIYEKDYRP
jgi:hypothetical protein